MEIRWEPMKSTGGYAGKAKMYRTPVPGGWLVMAYFTNTGTTSITFYPDPKHQWKK